MRQSNRNPDGAWKNGFLFVGNHLALDFLNTRPVQNGEPVELLPNLEALLSWFEAAGLLSAREALSLRKRCGESGRARQVLERLRQWRETLRKAVLAWESGDPLPHAAINELNRLMAQHPMRTKLNEDANGPVAELWFSARRPEDLFTPLAYAAATLFANVDRSRVRQCGNCVLHFYDTSKKGTRQWCSMRLCGNRLKVAAYAARRRRLVFAASRTAAEVRS
jgi:predicted RNA-binding Zn ribbon-like protein